MNKYFMFILIGIFILLSGIVSADLLGSTPEVYSFNAPPGPNVDLFTGDLSFGLPLMDVPGRGGMSHPISLGYSAGVKVGQESSWVGLGWNLAPGAIVRHVRGIPDDYRWDNSNSIARSSFSQSSLDYVLAMRNNDFYSPIRVPMSNRLAFVGGYRFKRDSI